AAPSSQRARRAPYSPPTSSRGDFVSQITARIPSAKRTGRVERSRQSSKRAHPARPRHEENWSRIPQFIPTYSFSARWQSQARRSPLISQPPSARNITATAHSSAADELSPLRIGTVLWITPSKPPSGKRSAASAQATPRG